MQPYSVEQSIIEGELEVKRTSLQYTQNNAAQFEAYEMERDLFARVMQIGLAGILQSVLSAYSDNRRYVTHFLLF